jgi:hypothetical protein
MRGREREREREHRDDGDGGDGGDDGDDGDDEQAGSPREQTMKRYRTSAGRERGKAPLSLTSTIHLRPRRRGSWRR